MDEKAMLMKAEAEREALLQELRAHLPQWTQYEHILMRLVAARVMREAGVPPDDALRAPTAMNHAVKQGIALGYALAMMEAEADEAIELPEGLFVSPYVIQAA